jgi:flagellar basal-body rod protein FlgF
MDVSHHVGLSALIALEQRLATVAHNVANASTAGFRAETMRFESLLGEVAENVSFAVTGEKHISRSSGPIKPTGNPLDVAIRGDYWFAIENAGGRAYTRDGRLQIQPDGTLATINGTPVLDVGGGRLRLEPDGAAPRIAADGMITQNGRQLGAIGLFRIPSEARLQRREGSAVAPDLPAEPVITFTDAGVVQGHVEGSNVNPVQEIMYLVTISRSFDQISASLDTNASAQKNAIRSLGTPG